MKRELAGTAFEMLFRFSPQAMVIAAREGTILDANDAAIAVFGRTRDETVGRTWMGLALCQESRMAYVLEKLRCEGFLRDEAMCWTNGRGERKYVTLSVAPIPLGGQVVHVSAFSDVTERNRLADQRQQAHDRFNRFIEVSPDAKVIVNGEGRIVQINRRTEVLFGYSRDELLGQSVEVLLPGRFRQAHSAHRRGYLDDPRVRPMGVGLELYAVHRNGNEFPVEISLCPVETEAGTLYCSAIHDVSEAKKAEAAIRSSLREKEVLLQEVHHRVKNNLQVIASLINMQRRKLEEGVARDALAECQSRVLAIALIHEKLYQSHDYGQVPFHQYIRGISDSVFEATGTARGTVKLDFEIEPVSLSVDRAIPCGLIVNELITNAVKHAFPPGGGGCIRVRLGAREGRVHLEVSDNGVGLPDWFDLGSSSTLGVLLVRTLAEQLDAQLEVERADGAAFRLTFAARG